MNNIQKIVTVFPLLFLSLLGLSQQTVTRSFIHNGVSRSYIVYVPASYSPSTSVPLLLNFHGYSDNATQQMAYGDFRPYADSVGFIIAHPVGTRDNFFITHFNVGWGNSSADDLGFTDALLDTLMANYSIDTSEVYSTGFSNGGFISYQLACQLSNRFAAIASVSGDMSPSNFANCNPQKPVPVLQIHGTNDGTVPYNGNVRGVPVDSAISYWVQQNQTLTNPIITNLPDINTADGSTVTRYIYANGTNGSEVHLYKIINGDHTWPGTTRFGNPNMDIDGTEVVWNFLRRYNLSGKKLTVGVQENVPLSSFQLNPTITSERTTLFSEKNSTYQLFNTSGHLVSSGSITKGANLISLEGFANNMYFLKVEGKTFKLIKTN